MTDTSQWVNLYGDALYRFAFIRVRNAAVAEDLVQDTFLSALKAIERFNEQSSEKTWLIGILKHKIMDHFRESERSRSTIPTENTYEGIERFFDEKGMWRIPPIEWSEAPDKLVEKQEFWNVFTNCMDTLPLRERQLFTLREVDGIESKEACKLLDITATNLWVLLYRARSKLRLCLEKHWFSGMKG